MNGLFDRILILVMTIVFGMGFMGGELIYLALAVLIYAGLCYFFADSDVHIGITAAICVGMLVFDMLIPAVILVVYEAVSQACRKKHNELMILGATIILYIILVAAGAKNYIYRLADRPAYLIMFGVGMLGMAVYLGYMSTHYVDLQKKYLRERDDNEEFRQLTIQKNQLMRKQQDDQISMATLRERNRIAREIHDNVGHLLSRSILQMGALQAVYKDSPIAPGLKEVSDTLNESMNNIRESVHDLHNESLDLRKAVDDIINNNSKYKVKLEYDINSHVSRTVKYCFISIINEAFENVKKHSDADEIVLAVFEHPAFYQLVFHDNGHPGEIRESGIGLHNMRTRVEELGGNIVFTAQNGFRIFLSIPKEDKTGENSSGR